MKNKILILFISLKAAAFDLKNKFIASLILFTSLEAAASTATETFVAIGADTLSTINSGAAVIYSILGLLITVAVAVMIFRKIKGVSSKG